MLPLDPKRPDSRGSPGPSKSKPVRETGCPRRSKSPSPVVYPTVVRPEDDASDDEDNDRPTPDDERYRTDSDFLYKTHQKPTSKDHRSFAANLFSTVAFRMFEWLTPQALGAISASVQAEDQARAEEQRDQQKLSASTSETGLEPDMSPKPPSLLNGEPPPEKLTPPEPLNPSPRDPTKSRRAPEATLRSPQSSKPRRRASLEPPMSPVKVDEAKSPTKSPRGPAIHPDKLAKTLRSPSAMSRGRPEILSRPDFFGDLSPGTSTGRDTDESTSHDEDPSEDTTLQSSTELDASPSVGTKRAFLLPMDLRGNTRFAEATCPLPQSLNRIDADIVDFVCDVFADDNTGESPLDPLLKHREPRPEPLNRPNPPLFKKKRRRDTVSRRQWKAFNEQTLFHVLSDPRLLIASFTSDGDLFDSHTLWYCMFRLTRTVPSLVFHSLWMAADSLFIPPKGLQNATSKLPKSNRRALNEFEAGCIMSICLHALAGSVPISDDKHDLRSLSWVRSRGLTLTANADCADSPVWMREQFDDAFSHDLAIRLARRLCLAVTARRQFANALGAGKLHGQDDPAMDFDILDPLFNQIDILGVESEPVLEFSEQLRILHQGRMQILTLEWARTVMFHEWQCKPDFSTTGPFSGALSIVESMCTSGPYSFPPSSRVCRTNKPCCR